MAQPTKKTIPSRYSVTPVKFAWTAGVTTPGQVTDWTPGDILLAWNSHATDAKTVEMVSNPKAKRTSDTVAAFTLAAGEFCVLPRFPAQDDDTITVIVSGTDVKLARLGTRDDPS